MDEAGPQDAVVPNRSRSKRTASGSFVFKIRLGIGRYHLAVKGVADPETWR
jgi:hypothetical protein